MASQLRVDSIESSVGSSVGIGTTGGTVTINGSVNISGGSVANVALTASSLSINGNAYPSVGPLSNRNLIINGAMQVAQRGTSSTGQTTTGYKAVDRFATGIANAGTWTITQSTDAPAGFSNSIKYDCTTSNASLDSTSELWITQRIEAQNLQHLNYGTADAQDCTFSFYFKTNKTGVYTVEIFQADSDRTVGFELNVTQTGWQKYSFVIPGDTAGTINNDTGIGLWCFIWMATGTSKTSGTFTNGTWAANATTNRLSSNTVNFADSTDNECFITGVQLEVGTVATPFEHRSYGQELALCQRYYKQILALQGRQNQSFFISNYGNTSAVNIIEAGLYDMRASVNTSLGPTGNTGNVQYYSYGGTWTSSTLTASTIGLYPYQQIYLYATADGDGRGKLLRRSGASDPDIYVEIDAEL